MVNWFPWVDLGEQFAHIEQFTLNFSMDAFIPGQYTELLARALEINLKPFPTTNIESGLTVQVGSPCEIADEIAWNTSNSTKI